MDNYYKDCPPVMQDGRLFTDYKSNTRLDEQIKNVNGIIRDDRYRLFLQKNATQLMDNIWDSYAENNTCWVSDCVHSYPTRSTNRYHVEERIKYDRANATRNNNRNCGVGCGLLCHKYADMRL